MPDIHSLYRIHKKPPEGKKVSNRNRYTLIVIEEQGGQQVAQCDIRGTPVHNPQTIVDNEGQCWSVRPNRKVMPSLWTISNPDNRIALQLKKQVFGKIASPLATLEIEVLDGNGNSTYRIVTPATRFFERFSPADKRYSEVIDKNGAIARIVHLAKVDPGARGVISSLKRFVDGYDLGFVSLAGNRVFSPTEVLGMVMIWRELINISRSVE